MKPPRYDAYAIDDVTILDFDDIETAPAPYPQRKCTVCGCKFVCFVGASLCDMCTDFLWIAKPAAIKESRHGENHHTT